MKVKTCGITNLEDALLCESAGADALGFIFYKKSKRYIEPDSAKEIIKHLSPFTMKVGVFVNNSPDMINAIAADLCLNAVQLHGEESPGTVRKINFPVIKSFRINNLFDFSILEQYSDAYFLFDTYSDVEYGGTGKTFNWEIIPHALKDKIILAGGISIDNIEDIFYKLKPAAVDLSSSLESRPGKKDTKKVKEFFKKINYLKPKAYQPPAERRKNGNNDEAQFT
jgi:phosphoribosylanthranilate isomerase